MSGLEQHPALRRLDAVLGEGDAEAELLLVGGAVLTVVFRHAPESRRASMLFGDPSALADAAAVVAAEVGLPADWLAPAVRSLLGERGDRYSWQGARLGVFSPRPAYALALKCAELGSVMEDRRRAVEADLRYLARLMDLATVDDVLLEVGRYFSARQLGEDVGARLAVLLA